MAFKTIPKVKISENVLDLSIILKDNLFTCNFNEELMPQPKIYNLVLEFPENVEVEDVNIQLFNPVTNRKIKKKEIFYQKSKSYRIFTLKDILLQK